VQVTFAIFFGATIYRVIPSIEHYFWDLESKEIWKAHGCFGEKGINKCLSLFGRGGGYKTNDLK